MLHQNVPLSLNLNCASRDVLRHRWHRYSFIGIDVGSEATKESLGSIISSRLIIESIYNSAEDDFC